MQDRTAKLRIDADLRLQADRLHDAAVSADLALRRSKLEELYVFLSDVVAQCSQTQAMLDYETGRDLEKHMARWTELREKVGRASAVAVTFPDISDHMKEIVAKIDHCYWTSRTFLQQDYDPKEKNAGWGNWCQQVIESSHEVAAAVSKVERAIENEARRLAEITPLFDVYKERWERWIRSGALRFMCIVKRDVLVLTEIEPQGISITNAADQVIHDLVDRGMLDAIKPRRIVYLDQGGQWDGLAVRDGNFAGFVMLGARSEEDAIQAAIQSDWNAQSLGAGHQTSY
jgi:hypothetical protein